MGKVKKRFEHIWYVGVIGRLLINLRCIFGTKQRKNIDRVILGSGGDEQEGFLSTDVDELNITKLLDWIKFFSPGSIETLVAEHLFEHLPDKDIQKAFYYCYTFLRHGGRLRIAVPDKNRKDLVYVNSVKPPADGHKAYFNYKELSEMLTNVGFKVKLLEYYDDKGNFFIKKWDEKYGLIKRSSKNDKQKKFKKGRYYYTSLIVDAFKP